MIRFASAVCLLSVLFAGAALADGHMDRRPDPKPAGTDELPPETEFFDEYDANADGFVTSDEYPLSAESFRLLDKDKDGKISTTDLGLPANYRPDPKAKAKRAEIRAREERGDGLKGMRDRVQKYLKKMDKDGDDKITREEWTGRAEMFDRFDRNKDGVLDATDRQQRGNGRVGGGNPKATFEKLDKNGDGQITEDEMPNKRLARADGDGDGAVSFKEFKQAMDKMRRGNQGKNRRGRGLNATTLNRYDRDGDGKVTADEFPGNERMFKRLDANGDGVLSKDDIQKAKPSDKPKKPAPVTTESGSLIKTHDKDGDGKLNRAEFQGTNEAWKQLDKNGDGWVTPDEAGEGTKDK